MRGLDDALAFALLKSTNPEQFERPWYMSWNQALSARSNMVSASHLWTSSEFSVGVGKNTWEAIFSRAKAEATLPAPATNNDPDKAFESMFFALPPTLTQTPMRDTKKRKLNAYHQSFSEALPETPVNTYKFKYKFTPVPPISFPMSQASPPISLPETSNSPRPHVSSSTEVTPARSQRDEDLSADERWEKVYRTRIVDFAVAHLLRDQKELVDVHNYTVHCLRQVRVPIVVEGKRSPFPEASGAEFEHELLGLLALAQKDIDTKRLLFFETYPCISFIGIAFAGLYWSFSICEPNSLRALVWSKPISMKSDTHTFVLDTIFAASEDVPENPGGHPGLQDFLRSNVFMPGAPFGFAESRA